MPGAVKSAGLEALICVVNLRRRYLSAVSSDDKTTEYARVPAVTDHDALRVRVQPNVAVIRDMVAECLGYSEEDVDGICRVAQGHVERDWGVRNAGGHEGA